MKLPVFSLFLQDKLQQSAVFHPLINYDHHPGFLSHLYLRGHAPSFSVSKTSACECFCPKWQFGSDFLCLCRPRWRGVALRRGRRRGDVGAIRGRILASLSYLQRLSATPYPQSSVLPRCSRERQVLKWRLLSSLQRTDVQTNLKLLAVGSHVHTKRLCISAPINIDHETPPTQTIFSLDCSKAARSTALKTRP